MKIRTQKPVGWLMLGAAILPLLAQKASAVATIGVGIQITARAASNRGGSGPAFVHYQSAINGATQRVHNNSRDDINFWIPGGVTNGDWATHDTGYWLWVNAYENGYNYSWYRWRLQSWGSDCLGLMMVRSSGPAGMAYQATEWAVMSWEQNWPVYAHEYGHCLNAEHDRGVCAAYNAGHTVMKWGYCSSGSVKEWYSNRHMPSWGDSYRDNTYRVMNHRWITANRR